MEKNILLICCGNPFGCDLGFGYHVSKIIEKMELPKNVEFMEVGESACMIPHIIEGKDKLIVIDVFETGEKPGTVVRLKEHEVPIKIDGADDPSKKHLLETLQQIRISGKCPEAIFIGVVPKTIKTGTKLTSTVKKKIPEVIDMIKRELDI
jgi:hydrogenase maturation protease